MIDAQYPKTDPRLQIPESVLCQFSEFVDTQVGLHFPKERWRDLERGINSAAKEFGFNDAESCIQWFLSAPLEKKQIENLASHLTIGETYFFRDQGSFEVLEGHILPELINSRRGKEQYFRIWSAGCSSGEEAYSIAVLLSKMLPDLNNWSVMILATDINPRFLRKAKEGVYSEWSFRNTPAWVKESYFSKGKDGFAILPHIKKMVTFSYLNLAEDTYPCLLNNTNAMDIIFCRNVLMYFATERSKKVIQNLYRCLLEGGYLLVSPVEVSQVLFPQFKTVNFPGVILYKKENGSFQSQISSSEMQVTSYKIQDASAKSQDASFKFQVPSVESQIKSFKSQVAGFDNKIVEARPLSSLLQTPNAELLTLYEEALSLYERGHYAESTGKIMLLLSQNGEDAKAMALLARAYANQGRLQEAVEWCNKAIVADKLNPGLYYLLATVLQEQGRVEEAVVSLRRTLYIDQNFVMAHFAMGNLTQQQGKFTESKKYFETASLLLNSFRTEDVLPESEGMTAGRLIEIIKGIGEQG